MKLVKVGAASLNQTPLDWDGNFDRIVTAVKEAHERGVQILCLPELCITGYGCEDAFLSPNTANIAMEQLLVLATELQLDIVFTVGLPVRLENSLYNCVAIVSRGVVVGIIPKQHLASDGVHYEPRWFKAWKKYDAVSIGDTVEDEAGKITGPIHFGDLVASINGIRVGFEICEDAWVADRPGAELAKRGVDIILNPSASHFAFGKSEIRKGFILEGSRAFRCTYVYANLLGNEAGRMIYDGDTFIASNGKMVAAGKRFSLDDHTLISAVVDVSQTRTAQCSNGSHRPDFLRNTVSHFTEKPWSHAEKVGDDNTIDTESAYIYRKGCGVDREMERKWTKKEEFEAASSLGLWDYMRKSRLKGFILSLSGGADSSAVAVMVHKMVSKVLKERPADLCSVFGIDLCSVFGIDHTYPHHDGLQKTVMSEVLTCVYQSTEHSGKKTFESAQRLSDTLGARFIHWSVDDVVSAYKSKVEYTMDRKLSWEQDDIALQNIQARVRAPGVWMLANIHGALLLTTSNRSEAAVGYATMDGDTCGGLAPIAGLDKDFILKWLRDVYFDKMDSYSYALSGYIGLTPTAELRPEEMNQTDEDDLMPYQALEFIEELAIRDKMGPVDLFNYCRAMKYFSRESDERLISWITKFFTLWSRNQWKRERYAPSFHFDDENLDPRSWCRWPILSAGFRHELKQLTSRLTASQERMGSSTMFPKGSQT